MAFNKLFEKFTGNNQEENGYEELTDETVASKVVRKDNTMILLEPRAYSESQQIADYLKTNSSVVVNLRRVTPDQAKRIVDFLSGTIYAIEGDLQKLGGGIFLCTPKSVNVEGKISDEGLKGKEGNKTQAKANKQNADEEEDEFNW
ncbi:MAG: cell division protein SepF [Bacilli bacterium]|nr:cell division protein SepF [Bacilli bacterium]